MPQKSRIALSDARVGAGPVVSGLRSDGSLERLTDLAGASTGLLGFTSPTGPVLRLGPLARGDTDRPALERLTRVLPGP